MTAEQLRKSILQLAIQGKLVPQDPNDEPASILLERIRAEKQRLISEGKIKKGKPDSIIFKGEDNCHYRQFFADNKVLPEFQAGSYYEIINGEIKNIDDEIPFEIPDSWSFARFSSIIHINGGYAFKSENYIGKENGVRVLRISDFNEDGFNQKRPVYHKCTIELKSFELEVNDIIMCMTGGTVGKSYFVEKLPEPMLVNQRVADIKINDKLNKKYCYYFILSPYIQKIIDESKNSTNDNISVALINSFIIPMPPIAEQERIVSAIEQFEPLLAEYDRLEKQATKLDSEIYDKLKKSILQYAIQGKLVEQDENDEPASVLLERIRAEKKAKLGKKYVESYIFKGDDNCYYEKVGSTVKNITDEIPFDIPENWSWCRLPEIGVSELGKTLNKEKDVGQTVPYLCSINVYWDKISLTKIKSANFSVNDINKYRLQKGDLLMCEGGEAGRCFVWEFDKEMYYQNALHRIRFNDNISPLFFKYVFEAYYAIGIIDNYCKGVTIKHLVQGALHSILLPLPPLKEQQRILYKINEFFSKIKDEN